MELQDRRPAVCLRRAQATFDAGDLPCPRFRAFADPGWGAAGSYAALSADACRALQNDREAYTEAKSEFVTLHTLVPGPATQRSNLNEL
jgi:hypothetical protein